MTRASVIVVAHNSRAYLSACLGSIGAELGPDDELIVVDSGSSDGSAELVRSQFPTARLVSGRNHGYAGGNNRGATLARGEFLVLLNPDTRLEPGALAAMLRPFDDPAVGLVAACVVHMRDTATVNACGNTLHITGLAYCRGAGRPRAEYAAPTEVPAVSGAAFAIRRALFAALGGFDEAFFMYVEDTDLSWRARLAGFRCVYTPASVVAHDYHLAMSPQKAFYLDRNRHLMLLKCLGRAAYLRAMPALLLGELVTWAFLLLQGPRYWPVKPRVYAWLLHNRSLVRRSRAAAQAARRLPDSALLPSLSYRLDFGQLAAAPLAILAGWLLHPPFRAARWLMAGGAQPERRIA